MGTPPPDDGRDGSPDDDGSMSDGPQPDPTTYLALVSRCPPAGDGRLLRVALYDDVGGSSVLRGVPEQRGAALLEQCLSACPQPAYGFATRRVRAEDVAAGALEDFDVLVMPGGRGYIQGRVLGEDGGSALQRWVAGGGGYVGICGGANVASSDPFYLPSNCLQLLPTQNADSAPGLPASVNHRGFGPVAVKVTDAGRSILGHDEAAATLYYHNGPVLMRASDSQQEQPQELVDDEASGLSVLARYDSDISRTSYARDIRFRKRPGVQMRGQAAVVCGRFGSGRVLVFGPHPERRSVTSFRKKGEADLTGPTHWVANAVVWASGL
eukprot:TRINITY_DN3843_c0_g1_i1.p1 TRINITY_DN3843_c0_g1~~TRINITY_DN3843_c0_g1_i1.p1  ORF type:complete len:325 (+),score=89.66 TRINITY_DN3843_c0_g1_i1:51-1025(+)